MADATKQQLYQAIVEAEAVVTKLKQGPNKAFAERAILRATNR